MITLLLTLSWLNFVMDVPVPWWVWTASGIEMVTRTIAAKLEKR